MTRRSSLAIPAVIGAFLSLMAPSRTTGQGFTGTRRYYVFVKSWINGNDITEDSWTARKIKLDVNVEPQGPILGDRFDYKIYQSFGVEVVFRNDRIVRADYIPRTRLALANTTLGLLGDVRVTEPPPTISDDRTRVVFKRRIDGNPHLIFKAIDVAAAEAIAKTWGINLSATDINIHNTLELTITSSGATPRGSGSPFPTHYFWLKQDDGRPQRFWTQLQVQPSEFFRAPARSGVGESQPSVGPAPPHPLGPYPAPPIVTSRPPAVLAPELAPPAPTVDRPQPAKPAPPMRLPQPASPRAVTDVLEEIAVRSCKSPQSIDQSWLDRLSHGWLPTGRRVTDDRSASLSGCDKEVFLQLLVWNATRTPPRLLADWLRDRVQQFFVSRMTPVPPAGGRCGQPCRTTAPNRGQGLDDWCAESCGCRRYDGALGRCVP